jgi:hypothetical protein
MIPLQGQVTIFLSIVIEALPFLLAGVFASSVHTGGGHPAQAGDQPSVWLEL